MSSSPGLRNLSLVLQEIQLAGPNPSSRGGEGRAEGGVNTPSDSSFTHVNPPIETNQNPNDSPSMANIKGESNLFDS